MPETSTQTLLTRKSVLSNDTLFPVTVTRVVDGDTVDLSVLLPFNIRFDCRARLYRINTPEIRTRDKETKAKGIAARQRLAELISTNNIYASFVGRCKYGRQLTELHLQNQKTEHEFEDFVNINDMLVTEGHAIYKRY